MDSLLLFLFCLSAAFSASVKKPTPPVGPDTFTTDVVMPGYVPKVEEEYVATGTKFAREGYIVGFKPVGNMDRIHHMILFGCEVPVRTEPGATWPGETPCRSRSKILYAWARNAPPLQLPSGVGFHVGGSSEVQYLVLQMHYASTFNGDVRDYSGVSADMVGEQPPYLAAVYLFAANGPSIPPETQTHFMNMSCVFHGKSDLHPFAFRTHTHGLGRVVSAVIRRSGQFTLIGKRSPQWPQIFQTIDDPPTIHPGDTLAAQCRYNSSGIHKTVDVGAHGANEMCNFYMMYYVDASLGEEPDKIAGGGCYSVEDASLFEQYPARASALLPARPEEEEHARQSHVHFGVEEVSKWTAAGGTRFGQISGVSLDGAGNIWLFHRGSVIWDGNTFDDSNRLRSRQPVVVDPVLKVDGKTGSLLSSWGKNKFYMPHGITVDERNNVWLTDVGMHQVFKMDAGGRELRSWGAAFQPGRGEEKFCKPTAVAVLSGGGFFVADGYCNNRVVEFDAAGAYKRELGRASTDANPPLGTFLLPHDLTLHESHHHLHVADRQNGRMQVLSTNGTPVFQVRPPDGFRTVYSADYCENTNSFYLLPGEQPKGSPKPIRVFSADPVSHLITYSFAPKSEDLVKPHVVRVGREGRFVYVGEIRPEGGVLWKFEIKPSHSAQANQNVASNGGEVPGGDPKGGGSGSAAYSKPLESEDVGSGEGKGRSFWSFLLILALAVLVPFLLIGLVCACVRFRKQGGFRAGNLNYAGDRYFGKSKEGAGRLPLLDGAFRSHKGFQPLSTEDVDAIDDLTEEESETEDTLYTAKPKRPLNA